MSVYVPDRQEWRRRRPEGAFGILLDRHRRRAGLSQSALADRAGMDYSLLSRLRSGDRTPTVESLAKLAAALDLSESEAGALAVSAMQGVRR